jgi:hypothetical protein
LLPIDSSAIVSGGNAIVSGGNAIVSGGNLEHKQDRFDREVQSVEIRLLAIRERDDADQDSKNCKAVRRQSIWHRLSYFLRDIFLPVLSPV